MAASPPVAPPAVLAVVVTDGITRYLPETLRGLAEQRTLPSSVLLVDRSPGEDHANGRTTALRVLARDAGLPLELVRIAHAPQAATFGDGVREGLRQLSEQGSGGPDLARSRWLWFLHDDSAPEPGALEELHRTGEGGPSVALVGAKQREWAHPDHLISVGVTVTPGGRRFTGVEDGELDQGQHDGREDVYAVGTAGSLVRHEAWDTLGGTDPVLGPFGDGLGLSRRARLAGFRVVVAPRAVVRHARASYHGLRPGQAPGVEEADDGAPPPDVRRSFRDRRVALLHARLVDAHPLAVPVLAVAAALGAILRAIGRIATKEPRLAAAEIGAAAHVLTRPGAIRGSRARVRAGRRVPNRQIAPLRAGWRDVWRVGRDRRLQASAARRARRAPSELEIAERAQLAARRRGGFVVTLLLSAAVALVAFAPLLAAATLTGGALLPSDADLGILWQSALGGWVAAGDGAPGPADPLLSVLTVPTFVAGGSVQGAVSVLVLGAIPLAGIGAYAAAGAATRSVRLRVWAGLAWALAPSLLLASGQGRLGGVVAHVAIPWVALGIARAIGAARRDEVPAVLTFDAEVVGAEVVGAEAVDAQVSAGVPSAAAGAPRGSATDRAGAVAAASGAGLALAVAAAGAPVLLPAGLLALVLVALIARRRRGFLALVAIPPVVLLAPLLAEAVRDVPGGTWRVLLADPGVPLASDPGPAYLALLGWPMVPPPWPVLPQAAADVAPVVASAVLVGVALLALLRGGRRRRTLTGWLLVLVGLLAALGASRVDVALGTAVDGSARVVRGWAGPGTSVVLAGLLVAVLAGADGLTGRLAERAFGWRQVVAAALAGLVVLAVAAGGVSWLWQVSHARTSGEATDVLALRDRGAVVPALGRELQRSPQGARVLVLEPTSTPAGDELAASLWRGDGDQLQERSVAVAARALTGPIGLAEAAGRDPAEVALADLVASLAVGKTGNPSDELARHAVAVVLVPPGGGGARERLVARLDATGGLERVTENQTGTVWRVAPPEGSALIARARVVSADGTVTAVVPTDGVSIEGRVEAGENQRLVVLAERADVGWRAWLDGEPLRSRTVDWQQAFELGSDGGDLVVAHVTWRITLLHTVQAVVLGLFAVLALPLRRRRVGST